MIKGLTDFEKYKVIRPIIEDCEYGFCHGCLTLGSESVYNHNIIMRRIQVTSEANNLLWLKCRPDTPQQYEYVTVEDITGTVRNFLYVGRWTQFYDLLDRKDPPYSYVDHITMRRCKMNCTTFFNAKKQEDVCHLSNFTFEDLDITARNGSFDHDFVEGFTTKNITINGEKIVK